MSQLILPTQIVHDVAPAFVEFRKWNRYVEDQTPEFSNHILALK